MSPTGLIQPVGVIITEDPARNAMKGKLLTPTLFGAALGLALLAAPACAGEARVPMAKLCGSCHTPEPGVMMGFLDSIALKSKTIQMDFMDYKDVVKFTDATTLKYVNSFDEIKNYRTKGFQINFVEKDGAKIATEIIRFDILRAITDEEKLDKDEFLRLRKNPQVKVYDVRPLPVYQAAHIPGAMPMPAPAFDKFVKNLPPDKTTPVIFYGVGGCLSPTAAMKTKSLGYQDVKIYTGGYPEWTQAEFGMVDPGWLQTALVEGNPQVIIDLRPAVEVAAGHIQGAVGIPLADLAAARDRFPSRKNAPIVFYGPGSTEAAAQATAWGYKMVRILPVSFEGWQGLDFLVASGPAVSQITYVPKAKPGTIGVAEFQKLAASPSSQAVMVDVRNPDELEDGMVAGALNLPVDDIVNRVKDIPAEQELILYCNTGIRAEMAHSLLDQAGRRSRYLDANLGFDDRQMEIEEH